MPMELGTGPRILGVQARKRPMADHRIWGLWGRKVWYKITAKWPSVGKFDSFAPPGGGRGAKFATIESVHPLEFMLFDPNVSCKTPKIGGFVTTEFGGVRYQSSKGISRGPNETAVKS